MSEAKPTKSEAKPTKSEAVILVMKKIDGVGGPTKFGIGAAAMRMALQQLWRESKQHQVRK
jgi:hypothetical protein